MAELGMGGEPVFVDVGTAPATFTVVDQFPQSNYQQDIVKNVSSESDIVAQSLYKAICIDLDSDAENNEADNSAATAEETQTPAVQDEQTPLVATDASDANVHMEDNYLHVQSRRYKCPECNKYTAETEEKIMRHVRKIHRGENPFQCFMCEYSTYNKTLFEEHTSIHQGIKPYKCGHCKHRSVSKKNMKKHELRHRSDNPLKCGCGFIARHKRSLECHKMICKGQRSKFKCVHCKYSADTESELALHAKVHGTVTSNLVYKCLDCEFKTKTEDELVKHKPTCTKQKIYVRQKRLQCNYCNYTADSESEFTEHTDKHTYTFEVHKCLKCDFKSRTEGGLRKHTSHCQRERRKKDSVKKKPVFTFKCCVCSWESTNKAKILLHLIHHPKQKVDKEIDISILQKYGIM